MSTELIKRVDSSRATLHKETLEDLLIKAEEYGEVSIVSYPPSNKKWDRSYRHYFARVTFNTVQGIALEAKSTFDNSTLKEALIDVLIKAKKIQEQFK